MFHWFINRAAVAVLLAWPAAAAFATDKDIRTDANLITALDVSDSIMRHEEWLEFEGLARAVVDPVVLDAISSGRHGRIGLFVFAWSSGGRVEVLVPWTVIASTRDAERVAAQLRLVPRILRPGWAHHEPRREPPAVPDRRTDISASLEFAIDVALDAPHAAGRSIVNVCANGEDNVGADPRAARDRAVAAGMVVNGLAIGPEAGRLADYFRTHVQGGTGSFVLQATRPAALADAMVQKLLRDLIAARRVSPVPLT